MKQNLKSLLHYTRASFSYIIFLFCLISCNRDTPSITDSNVDLYLSRVTIDDSANNFLNEVKFYYDGAQRVSSMSFHGNYIPSNNPQDFIDSFYYISTDTLPWKIASTVSITGQTTRNYVSYLTYDSQNRKVKDSLIRDDFNQTYIRKYTRTADYLVDNYIVKDSILFAGGNMTKAYRGRPGNFMWELSFDSIDNEINPYSKLNIAEAYFKRHSYFSDDFVIYAREYFGGHFNMQSLNMNNVKQWRLTDYITYAPDTAFYIYKSQYTYNADNYPVSQYKIISFRIGNSPYYVLNRLKYTYSYY